MMLTTKGRYAVMALVDMASLTRFVESPKPVSLADISARQDITVAYLEQIFSKLKHAGLVKSVRGPGGGYVLARASGEIKIADIINAVEEQIKMTRCGSHKTEVKCKVGGKCSTHDLWDGLSQTIEGYLESVTVADVVNRKLETKVEPSLRATGGSAANQPGDWGASSAKASSQ